MRLYFLQIYAVLILFVLFFSSNAEYLFENSLNVKVIRDKEDLEPAVGNFDSSVFLFIYHDDSENSKRIAPLVENYSDKYEGYLEFYALDCGTLYEEDPDAFAYCSEENIDTLPAMKILKPPQYKINPYTKEEMQIEEMNFPPKELSEKDFSNFLLGNMQDFTHKLTAETVLNFKNQQFLNKIILFTEKKKTPPMFKALSSNFKDRLLFGVVPSTEATLVEEYGIKAFPTIVIEQTVDIDDNSVVEKVQMKYKGAMDYSVIHDFIFRFARKDKPNEEEIQEFIQKQEEKLTPLYLYISSANFTESVLREEMASFVYFKKGDISEKFLTISQAFRGAMNVFIMDLDSAANKDFAKNTLKLKKIPNFKFFPYNFIDSEKLSKSIDFSSKYETEEILEDIGEKVPSRITHLSAETFDQALHDIPTQKQKYLIIYFYRGDDLPLFYKALSNHKLLNNKITFAAFLAPPDSVLQSFAIKSLPKVAGIFPKEDLSTQNFKLFTYVDRLEYSKLFHYLLQIVGLTDETDDKSAGKMKKTKGKVEQITANNFEDICTSKSIGICIIGVLEGLNHTDELKSIHTTQLEILKKVRRSRKDSPLDVMWINGTCHADFLREFNIDSLFIPTILAYVPSKLKYSNLIGKFSYENIDSFITKLMIGKGVGLSSVDTHPMPRTKDCRHIMPTTEEDDVDRMLEEEILREILEEAEEKEKEKAQEEEEAKARESEAKPKKKNKKKSKKKKHKTTDL